MTQEKYSVHVVEMVRNNGITQVANESSDCFFMFDYFDALYHKELSGAEKKYVNYLCIKDSFEDYQNYKVSYKVLSLYQHSEKIEEKQKENPFKLDGDGLSDAPFIGLVQITLCKENYVNKEDAQAIDAFLCHCEKNILSIVETHLKQNDCHVSAKQLYRSSTTGDFCLVLRTESVEAIYRIAIALNDTQSNPVKGMSFFTYTNVGMECKVKDGRYCTLSNDFISRYKDLMFALRFSATTQFGKLLEQYVQQRNKGKLFLEKAKGLFGRYDYLLNICIEEFAEIYPILCEKKLGAVNETGESGKKKEADNTANMSLSYIIQTFFVQNINERILINISDLSKGGDSNSPSTRADRKNVMKKNKEVYGEIEKLDRWHEYYAEEHREFKELLRCMKEMCRTFLPAGMEQDAYINWIVFRKDVEVLCECIDKKMEELKAAKMAGCDEEELKRYRVRLLKNWRQNIQAINQYTKLVQNVNYQTYQSPVYEIQTQIDTEKAMVAYREVMENYLCLYSRNAGDDDKRDVIRTLIYPEMAEANVQVSAPFSQRVDSGAVEREIFCTVPSFEYFGRLYDLLPWLIHECSHQIRVLPRKERNIYIVKDILKDVFTDVVLDVFAGVLDDDLYEQIGWTERNLITIMTDVAYSDIFDDEKTFESGFEEIVFKTKKYLEKLFGAEYTFLEQRRRSTESRKDIREKVTEALMEAGRSNGLIDEDYLKLIKEIKGNDSSKLQVQEVLKKLLESYGMQMQESLTEKLRETLQEVLQEILPEALWKELSNCLRKKRKEQNDEKVAIMLSLEKDDTMQLECLQVPIEELDNRLMGTVGRVKSRLGEQVKEKIRKLIEEEIDKEKKIDSEIKEEAIGQTEEQFLADAEIKNILRNYCFSVKKMYRIQKKYANIFTKPEEGDYVNQFLEKVFDRYQDDQRHVTNEDVEKNMMCADPLTLFALRSLGLLNRKKNDVFCDKMKRFIRARDVVEMRKIAEFRVRQYRETFADMLMTLSLQIGSFGYCRQVFQTISDTKIDKKRDLYDSVNAERFRIVTAVLLTAEGAERCEDKWDSKDDVRIKGETLIEQSKVYCEHTLKCIRDNLFQREEFQENDENKKLLIELLGTMNGQLAEYMDHMSDNNYKNTLLYFMLHGKSTSHQEEIREFWKRYAVIEKYLVRNHYQFLRLEYLCMGLHRILTEDCVVVPKRRFEYIYSIWKHAKSEKENPSGCKWEDNMPGCLTAPKLDVGKFYNDPRRVYTMDAGEKLENTIDFIQNYYYNNRFRIMEKEKGK